MKTLPLKLFLISMFLCAASANTRAFADAESEIPFTFEKGHVIVSAKIKGNTPVEMVLATGAEHSIINGLVLDKYKLRASYTGEGIIRGDSSDRIIYFVTVSDLRISDVKVASLNMRLGAQTASEISQRIGREIFAILGADFFKGRIVQFDFQPGLE